MIVHGILIKATSFISFQLFLGVIKLKSEALSLWHEMKLFSEICHCRCTGVLLSDLISLAFLVNQ